MTTDKELLELASKATGLQFAINGDDLPGYVCASDGDWRNGWCYWNPLLQDADAFRLAVKLGIDVYLRPAFGHVTASLHVAAALEEYGADPYAATRRAIVRAAAAIGETK